MSVYRKGPIELRLGDYRETLADVEPDAVITDPPYGARTHGKQMHGRRKTAAGHWCSSKGLGYAYFTDADAAEMIGRWALVAGWTVVFSSHDLAPAYEAASRECDRYPFAPLPAVVVGMNVRLAGDGPSSWTTWVNVARPRRLRHWGTLPGAYHGGTGGHASTLASGVVGAKPLWLMRALVRDYSRPGDLVCDPCAGGATTLIAAALEGRRAIGSELDPDTYEKACKRIERTALTPPLPGLERAPMDGTQGGLDL